MTAEWKDRFYWHEIADRTRGILIGMGILLFIFAATVAFILGVNDESEPRQNQD